MPLGDAFKPSLGNLLLDPDVPDANRRWVAWNNAPSIFGWDASIWRQDQDGRVIRWGDYGTNDEYGWHVHHILDQALGGRHNAGNLVARHWLGNTQAGGVLGALLNGGR
jgi:hypothetical protein